MQANLGAVEAEAGDVDVSLPAFTHRLGESLRGMVQEVQR